ncbi:MAG: hypothetical protein KF810_06915 [Rhizobiaceae bacterium]|nr:hypothetical protein [Rhizobiaceae bacterium]
MRNTLLASILVILANGPASATEVEASCPAERAVYTLKSDPAFTAGFIPAKHYASMASNLYFWVRSPQRTYWFTLTTGVGYTGISLSPVGDLYIAAGGDPDNGPVAIEADSDSLAHLRIYPMDRDWTVMSDPPNAGDPAPYAMFAPEIGTVLWYSPRDVTLDETAERDAMERGVFILTGCLDAAPKPALP